MPERLVLHSHFGEHYVLTSWIDASPFQRACAVDRRQTPHLLERTIGRDFGNYRLQLLSIPGMGLRSGVDRLRTHDLRETVVDQLSQGRLILIDEGLHLPPCGVGLLPESADNAPATSGSNWSGDSARWTQQKKILSMQPTLRPLVQGVIDGLAKRGFQPSIFFGWRSVAVQLEIYKKHHTKVKFSFHNAQMKDGTPNAYAADIIDKRWAWSAAAAKHGFWKALGEEAKKQGLYWGGDWKKPDWAHVQLVPNSQLKKKKKESGL